MTGSTARLVTLALLAVAGLGGLVTAAQPWWRLVGDQVDARITGSDASSGLAQVLPVCLLVVVLLSLVLHTLGRRVVGGLTVLLGVGLAVLGASHPRPAPDTVRQTLRQSSLADTAALTPTGWPWAYLAMGLLAVAGGVLMLTRAHRWPSRAGRYARGAVATATTGDPDTWWKAMDAGVDPTADPTVDPTAEPPADADDPISAPDAARVTMAEQQQPAQRSDSSPPQGSTAEQPGRGSDQ